MKINYYQILLTFILLTTSISSLFATEEDNTSQRFSTITFEKQIILQDNYSKLEWVNGKDENSSIADGFKKFPKNKDNIAITIKNESKKYCEELTFATYKDWRVPTVEEHQTLIQTAKEQNFSLYYTFKECPRVIAISDNKLATINTHNTQPTAKIIPWKEGQAGGLRCVRDAEAPLAP